MPTDSLCFWAACCIPGPPLSPSSQPQFSCPLSRIYIICACSLTCLRVLFQTILSSPVRIFPVGCEAQKAMACVVSFVVSCCLTKSPLPYTKERFGDQSRDSLMNYSSTRSRHFSVTLGIIFQSQSAGPSGSPHQIEETDIKQILCKALDSQRKQRNKRSERG